MQNDPFRNSYLTKADINRKHNISKVVQLQRNIWENDFMLFKNYNVSTGMARKSISKIWSKFLSRAQLDAYEINEDKISQVTENQEF